MKIRFTPKNENDFCQIYFDVELDAIPRKGDLISIPEEEEEKLTEKGKDMLGFNEFRYGEEQDLSFDDLMEVNSIMWNLKDKIAVVEFTSI